MNEKRKINQLKCLQDRLSHEASITRLHLLNLQEQRNNSLAERQQLESTYHATIQAHNKLLSNGSYINPDMISHNLAYLAKLQDRVSSIDKLVKSLGTEICEEEKILMKLLSREKGYKKVSDNYVHELQVKKRKQDFQDSIRETPRKNELSV